MLTGYLIHRLLLDFNTRLLDFQVVFIAVIGISAARARCGLTIHAHDRFTPRVRRKPRCRGRMATFARQTRRCLHLAHRRRAAS